MILAAQKGYGRKFAVIEDLSCWIVRTATAAARVGRNSDDDKVTGCKNNMQKLIICDATITSQKHWVCTSACQTWGKQERSRDQCFESISNFRYHSIRYLRVIWFWIPACSQYQAETLKMWIIDGYQLGTGSVIDQSWQSEAAMIAYQVHHLRGSAWIQRKQAL